MPGGAAVAEMRDLALAAAREAGFDLCGIAGVAPSARLAAFAPWVESGQAGEMHYLARRGAGGRYLREAVREAWPWAQAVICAAAVYNAPAPRSLDIAHDPARGWISRYAWGDDYHDCLRRRLEQVAQRLRQQAPEEQFHLTVDTAPLIERAAAEQAGLGWQAKNTCLIHPRLGSYFFLGSIVTSLPLAADDPLPDRCGSCRRCIEACPTQALTPYAMDASRCIAYLNLELRGPVPEDLRASMGNNLIGCDICQDVCPWNRRAPVTDAPEFQPRPGFVAPLLLELAALTEDAYRERFRHSAAKRAKFSGLRRSLALAMGNSGNPAYRATLQRWQADADAVLAEHAAWALAQIEQGATA